MSGVVSGCSSPWWGGITVDHLYENCPNYRLGLPGLRFDGLDHVRGGAIDPHGTDVCGMCLHWHNQRVHPANVGLRLSESERFWSKVSKTETCWLWTAGLNRSGYGRFDASRKARQWLAHRWAYEALIGPIPAGLQLDHTCHNGDLTCPGGITCVHRRCVNPTHLEPVTNRTNVLRGRTLAAMHAAQTHCLNNHPLNEENTRVIRDGSRQCKACCRNRDRRYAKEQA